jgi:hypothetical protein
VSESASIFGKLDRWAIGLSGLCVVHCLATAVFVALFASVGGVLLSHEVHEVGLVIAVILAAVALGRGVLMHGYMLPAAIGGLGIGVMSGALTLDHGSGEVMYTLIGVALVALGHDLNRRALI